MPSLHARRPAAFLPLAFAAAVLVAESAGAREQRTYTAQKTADAELRYIGNVPIAILTGTPEDIGRQHANLVAEPAKNVIDFPKRFIATYGLEVFWPFVVQAGRSLTLNTPERHQRELHAIAAESELGEDVLVVSNTLLELRRMGCSSVIVEPQRSVTGGPLFGRNFDFPTLGEIHKYSVLLVCRPKDRHAFASIGFPGLVGVISGMNDAGLAVATLDVVRSADGSRKFNPTGKPMAFTFRRILEECTTVDEAEAMLKREQATTWMNLAVCDRDGGAVFEITPDNVGRRDDENGLVRCTNHFRSEGLSVGETCDRYDALLDESKSPLDVEAVQARLHAANQGDLTFQTMVFEPRDLVLNLAIGVPPVSDDALTRIELRPLFEAAVAQAPPQP